MQTCILGRTNLSVSRIGLGAGPVPALMTGDDSETQRAVLARAVELGVNWIDTAAGYGDGRSEASLGRALSELRIAGHIHVATKVRFQVDDLTDAKAAVRRSVQASLQRLGLPSVTLLQLHNGVTSMRGDIAASLAPADVLGPVREALERMREEGYTRFIGLTGTGSNAALSEVIDAGVFDTVQIPHHILAPADAGVLARCRTQGMGVFAIRVFAGGALLGHAPSAHTLKTPYFPLALYEADRARAAVLRTTIGDEMSMVELAVRWALSDELPQVSLLGLATPAQVGEATQCASRGGLPAAWRDRFSPPPPGAASALESGPH